MLSTNKRWIQFHDLLLKSEPENAPNIDLINLITLWLQRINNKESVKLINNETAAIRVIDARLIENNSLVVLLFQYADTSVTDPAFSNLSTGEIRVEPKLQGEGVAVSAHVIIELQPNDDLGVFYRFLLEEVPGLGRSRISDFIRSELKHVAQGHFEFQDFDNGNETRSYRPSTEVLAVPSISLGNEFAQGCVVQGIELIKYTPASERIDEQGFYTESTRILRLRPDPNATLEELWGKIKDLAQIENCTKIKYRYKDIGGKGKTATMNGNESDIADMLVSRTELVEVDDHLAQCSAGIVGSMMEAMVELLNPT